MNGDKWRDRKCFLGLDIFWLRDESLEESDNLPDPDVLAQEIVEDFKTVLEHFREIATDLDSELIALRRRTIQSHGKIFRFAEVN